MALAAFGCSTAVVVINAISLAFLILATITAPVVSSLGLAEADGVRYGVFGVCSTGRSSCSSATFPYDVTSVGKTNDWKMDDNARDTLSKILIVAPIAAGLTLISLIFNFFAHFKAFGSSLAFYLIGFIFTLLAFCASAVICIATFLLFFPHVTWLAWLLIPATVLNLFAVPLVFFALRTTPKKFEDEEDEEIEDKNLTDLSDGDNFRSNNEFKLDDFSVPPNAGFTNNNLRSTSSSEKNIPVSSLKVITNDSSSINDQRSGLEKATIHDYSTNANPTSNYNYDGKIQTQHYVNPEGTPNLVSSQNYGRGGAIRSEAPVFKPQAAKPDYSTAATSLYPKSAYQSTPPKSGRSQQRPINSQRIQQPNYARSQQGSVSSGGNVSVPPTTGGSAPVAHRDTSELQSQNVLGESTHGSLVNSDDDDNELTNDNDSDFTSVSQRAVNPRYFRGAKAAPTLFPSQEQQQLVSPVHGGGGIPPAQVAAQQYYPSTAGSQPLVTPQQQSFPDHSSSYYSPSNAGPVSGQYSPQKYSSPSFGGPSAQGYAPSQGYAPQQQGYSPQPPQQQPQPARKNTSDVLLSTNPDFMISGPAFQKQNNAKRINPTTTPTYRPAYKRNQAGASKVSAASLAGDSPYNFK